MTELSGYHHFDGVHWETGSIHNALAYQGVVAPHTGKPYSEALLLGVGGGIAVGYFHFAYEGYDPQCNILTRNTFDPWDTLLSRLGVVQTVHQSTKADKGVANLLDVLADGAPAVVWPDRWSLPYNALTYDKGMWGAFPLIVYGYDETGDVVKIADRARVGLTVTPAELAEARGRIKKDRYRVATLDLPGHDKLASAVQLGILDCIKLMTEKPPKGSKNNFGLTGLAHWADMLAKPTARKSWARLFPAGAFMYAGLTSAYEFSMLFGKGLEQDAERSIYAAFLDEAAVILERPHLRDAADLYRESGGAWTQLPGALLPDAVPLFQEARTLLLRRHRLFLREGGGSLTEREQINARLADLRAAAADDFPLNAAAAEELRQAIATQLQTIREAEAAAVQALQRAMT